MMGQRSNGARILPALCRWCFFLLVLPSAVVLRAASFADFIGPYDPIYWALTNDPEATGGDVNTTGAPNIIVITGGDAGIGGTVTYTIPALGAGKWSFDWSYNSSDSYSETDFSYYIVGTTMHKLAETSSNIKIFGSTGPLGVAGGEIIGFGVFTSDGLCGPGVLEIWNHEAPIPEPAAPAMIAVGLIVLGFMRKRMARRC